MTLQEVFEHQEEIIRLQSESIDELFRLLLEHVAVEEITATTAFGKMTQAAKLNKELKP